MIDGKNFLYQPVGSDMRTYITFAKSQMVREMITQLVVYKIIITLIITIK